MAFPKQYAKNTATGIIEPVEMADGASSFTLLNFSGSSLTLPSSGASVVYSEQSLFTNNATMRYLVPGSMIPWEIEADITLEVDFDPGVTAQEVEMSAEVYFSPLPASVQFTDGIEHNHTTGDAANRVVHFYTQHHVALLAWLWASKASGNCERSVTWWAAPQLDWGKSNWLKVITVTGSTMTVHLKLQFDVPDYRSGRCAVTRYFGESPYYLRALQLTEPESGLADKYDLNWLSPPVLRDGLTGESTLLSATKYRSIQDLRMSGQPTAFLLNEWLNAAQLSADVSYLRDSDERDLTFSSTGDVTHSEDFTLDKTADSSFPYPYQMYRYCILRLSRSIAGGGDTTATGSITNVKMRVIDPT